MIYTFSVAVEVEADSIDIALDGLHHMIREGRCEQNTSTKGANAYIHQVYPFTVKKVDTHGNRYYNKMEESETK